MATLLSYFVYLIFPTFVTRPAITSTDLFSKVLVVIYQTDRAYNAAPSGHTFYSILSFLYLSRWKPKYKPIWILATLLILASALLTKQHYVLDIVCGLALGILAFAVGRFSQTKWNLKFASQNKWKSNVWICLFYKSVIRCHMLASPTKLPDYFQRAFGEIFGLIQVEKS